MYDIKKELVTTKETANILGVSIKSVYNYIRQNKLKCVRLGGTKKAGRTYIHIEEIKRFLKG